MAVFVHLCVACHSFSHAKPGSSRLEPQEDIHRRYRDYF